MGKLRFFLSLCWCSAVPLWALSINVPPPVASSCVVPRGDGVVTLWNYPHQELHTLRYDPAADTLTIAEQAALNQALRSPDGIVADIDPRVLWVADHLQDHFRADSVEVISGFRSREYNTQLKTQGRNVATESQHMHGDAIDLHLDEVREFAVRDYVQRLGCGGVGFYPANAFVHVDFGPVRQWAEPPARARAFVGERPLLAESDRNEYAEREAIALRCRGTSCQDSRWRVEHFVRGAWLPQQAVSWRGAAARVVAGAPGKYRLATDGGFSNEWYVKR